MMGLAGWLIFIVLLLTTGVLIGLVLYDYGMTHERVRLAERERQLRVERDALERTQRINEKFWQARTAMRNEALRASPRRDRPSAAMTDHGGGTWLKKVTSAVAVLLLVAATARMVWWLIEPLVPGLIILLTLIVVFGLAFGLFRRP